MSINLYSNGTTYCNPPALITASCEVAISDFPFDEKNCVLKWGRYLTKSTLIMNYLSRFFNLSSWMYTSNYIQLNASSPTVFLNNYIGKKHMKLKTKYEIKN